MNPKRKVVTWAGILLGVAAGLYPPWPINGYGWLWENPYRRHAGQGVDMDRLLIEWFLIAIVSAGVFFSVREK
jgi:hypothetical protein